MEDKRYRIYLSRLIPVSILLSFVAAITTLGVYGAITKQTGMTEAEQALTVVKALDAHISKESDRFTADLQEAIKTVDASASPEAIGEHIRSVTKAKWLMIVAPYNESLEPETEAFNKATVYSFGTDAALTTNFQITIQNAKGKAVSGVALLEEMDFISGRPIKIGNLNGYVLIAKPLKMNTFDNMRAKLIAYGSLYQYPLPRGTLYLDSMSFYPNHVYWAGYLRNAPSLTVYVELAGYKSDLVGRIVLTAPKESAASQKWVVIKPYLFSMLAALLLGTLTGLVLIPKAYLDARD